MIDFTGNYEEQIKLTKINTIILVLHYRFPQMGMAFLYQLTIPQLDEIIDHIATITKEELEAYQQPKK